MPAKNPRLNITVEKEIAGVLADLARQENKSISGLAKELILESLERREDQYFSSVV